jgi:hypothetical protein
MAEPTLPAGERPLIQSYTIPISAAAVANQGLFVPHSRSVPGQAAPERFCK